MIKTKVDFIRILVKGYSEFKINTNFNQNLQNIGI